jgi:hypothetical protein
VAIVLHIHTSFINKSPDAEQISRGEAGRQERAIMGMVDMTERNSESFR